MSVSVVSGYQELSLPSGPAYISVGGPHCEFPIEHPSFVPSGVMREYRRSWVAGRDLEAGQWMASRGVDDKSKSVPSVELDRLRSELYREWSAVRGVSVVGKSREDVEDALEGAGELQWVVPPVSFKRDGRDWWVGGGATLVK